MTGEAGTIRGKEYENKIKSLLRANNYHIFGENIKIFQDRNIILEIDILLHRTIIECKCTTFTHQGDIDASIKQINKYIKYFPTYKIILWLENSEEYKKKISLNHSNLFIINTIEEFKQIYQEDKFYIDDKHINSVASFISNLNPNYNYLEHLYSKIYIHRTFAEQIKDILVDPNEIAKYYDFYQKINIVPDDFVFNSFIKLDTKQKSNNNHFSLGQNIEQRLNNYFYYYITPYSLDKINIEIVKKLYAVMCQSCNGKFTKSLMKDKLCKKCYYKQITFI